MVDSTEGAREHDRRDAQGHHAGHQPAGEHLHAVGREARERRVGGFLDQRLEARFGEGGQRRVRTGED
jgi:hypothetical protein